MSSGKGPLFWPFLPGLVRLRIERGPGPVRFAERFRTCNSRVVRCVTVVGGVDIDEVLFV